MRLIALLLAALAALCHVDALYFYLDPKETRCFHEELPSDTVVVGHYMAETWDKQGQHFTINENLGIGIEVREVETSHVVTSTVGPPEGKFAFTSHTAGDHSICLQTLLKSNADERLPMDSHQHQVRMHLDIIIGDAKPDTSVADRAHIKDLASRVRELNDRLRDIRKEQQFQREREAAYRDISERVNTRATWYPILQGVVLVATCAWQATHLRAFFDHRKIR